MALPIQPFLRRGPSTTATTLRHLLSTLKAPTPPQQPAAAITRALHNISRHTTRSSRRLQQQQQQQQQHHPKWPLPRLRRRPYSTSSSPAPQKATSNPSSSPSQSTYHHHPPPPHPQQPQSTSPSLSARLRTLSREYGWSAFGVYLALSALDFPFCFLAVRSLGADTIGHYEHLVVGYVSGFIPEGVKGAWREVGGLVGRQVEVVRERVGWGGGESGEASVGTKTQTQTQTKEVEAYGDASTTTPSSSSSAPAAGPGPVDAIANEATGSFGKAITDADLLNQRADTASIWTQLALAYAIHKSFIFVRVPLTVAVTPRVVKFLRGLGWDIGRRRPKEVREAVKKARKAEREGK